MNLDDILNILPEHWEMWTAEESKDVWWDDGRDYDKPVFIRKDRLARIYFNIDPTIFSIAFDYHSDGDAYATFSEALKFSDWYIEKYPLEFQSCKDCTLKAVWYYTPASEMFLTDKFYCANHVPRGCSCNIGTDGSEESEELDEHDGVLKRFPCVEYTHNKYGFPKED